MVCSMSSSVHDHKEDLRKRLSFTTHKLEMVEMEFDSTRQYLETELRRAQEELDKFTDKLRRCVCVWVWAFVSLILGVSVSALHSQSVSMLDFLHLHVTERQKWFNFNNSESSFVKVLYFTVFITFRA